MFNTKSDNYLNFLNSLNFILNTTFIKIEQHGDHAKSKLIGWTGIKSIVVLTQQNDTYEIDIRYAWSKKIFSQNLIDYYCFEFDFSRKKALSKRNSRKKLIIYLCEESVGVSGIETDSIDRKFIVSDAWSTVNHIYLQSNYHHPFTISKNQQPLDIQSTDIEFNITHGKNEGGLRLKGIGRKILPDAPLISVVTVVRNGEKYIEQTIQSVINQSYHNVEYIIVDGVSSDKTLEIVKKYEDKIDYWLSEPDKGLSDVMNKGVELTTGKYISHLHADDFFLNPGLVEAIVEKIIANPSNWYTGSNLIVDYNGAIMDSSILSELRFKDMMKADIIKHPGTFVDRGSFLSIKFSSNYSHAMDYFFFLNLWRNFGEPVFLSEIDVTFRVHPNSLSSNYLGSLTSEMKARIDFRTQEKEYSFIPFDIMIYLSRMVKTFVYHYPLLYLNKLKFISKKYIAVSARMWCK